MTTSSSSVRFELRDDFHQELGWRDFIRDSATSDPAGIRTIVANRHLILLGPDPLTRLQRWEPLTGRYMFYFWLIRAGQVRPTFVATDGFFGMSLEPLPDDAHLLGLPDSLHESVLEAAGLLNQPGRLSPVMPPAPADGHAAKNNILPAWLVVHRYPQGWADLAPYGETLHALAARRDKWHPVWQSTP